MIKWVAALTFGWMSSTAFAQAMGDESANISVSGIVFARSLNDAAEGTSVAGDVLTLKSAAKRDNFNDPNGKLSNNTAPVMLTQVDNRQPFTFTARVAPSLAEVYDAGALYVWVTNDLWLKMAMELDERRKSRIVTVRTTGTSDDNNHDVIAAKGVHLKISSDTKTIGFYYSVDRREWQLVRLFKNEYPANIWVGVSAQSPMGAGAAASFSEMSLTRNHVKDFRLGL